MRGRRNRHDYGPALGTAGCIAVNDTIETMLSCHCGAVQLALAQPATGGHRVQLLALPPLRPLKSISRPTPLTTR
jgi:hypothetical protein